MSAQYKTKQTNNTKKRKSVKCRPTTLHDPTSELTTHTNHVSENGYSTAPHCVSSPTCQPPARPPTPSLKTTPATWRSRRGTRGLMAVSSPQSAPPAFTAARFAGYARPSVRTAASLRWRPRPSLLATALACAADLSWHRALRRSMARRWVVCKTGPHKTRRPSWRSKRHACWTSPRCGAMAHQACPTWPLDWA